MLLKTRASLSWRYDEASSEDELAAAHDFAPEKKKKKKHEPLC